jgi:hypothetical protein
MATNTINLASVDDAAKNLANLMQGILDAVINTYQSYSMPLPGRRYWTLGEPSVDCDQVVVSMLQMYIGSPGDEATEPRRCNDPRSATLTVSVSRAVPVVGPSGNAPTADDIQDASTVSAYDAWILLDSAKFLDQWNPNGTFGLGVIATVETNAPEGGYQTVTMTITVAVP